MPGKHYDWAMNKKFKYVSRTAKKDFTKLILILRIWPLVPALAIAFFPDIAVLFLAGYLFVFAWLVIGIVISFVLFNYGVEGANSTFAINLIVVGLYVLILLNIEITM